MLHLHVKSPDGTSAKESFEKASIMIGRAVGNDICLDTNGVSRYHARISVEAGQIVVQDLDSTNGTFVNSNKVVHTEIGADDIIMIGDATITVAYELAEESPYASLSSKSSTPATPVASAAKTNGAERSATKLEAVVPAEKVGKTPEKKTDLPKSEERELSREDTFFWQSLEKFFGPLWVHVVDEAVTEILINGHEEIFIERKGRLERVQATFSNDQLRALVLNIAQYVGRRVSEDEPYMDARLPDGSRVAVLLPPCSRKGVSVSIRKFAKEALTVEKLFNYGSLSQEMVTFMRAAVVLKKNIIVSGGTSSGKTSLLNVISSLIPRDERILTIEDSAELQLNQDHVLPMETKAPDKKGRGQVTIRDLVKASLRMRPDRIVVGEIRGGEALDLLQAMNTGHSGSMATVHASSPPQALTRLETLSLFSGVEIPMRALREQVSTAIEIIIQASRLPDHSRKVTHISEVLSLTDDGSYRVEDIFRFKSEGRDEEGRIQGKHIWTGYVPTFIEQMELARLTDATALFQTTKMTKKK